jgi:tRNA (Thr-GGU) A37 N-methylase
VEEMANRDRKMIEMRPIGFVSRASPGENERDRSLVAKVVLNKDLAPALDGIEEWSHIYVIFWLDRVVHTAEPELYHHDGNVGILAARSPIHPNPIGWIDLGFTPWSKSSARTIAWRQWSPA